MPFSYADTRIVKGMIARGDKLFAIAAYFGVAESIIESVVDGTCDYPSAPAAAAEDLPSLGPYPSAHSVGKAFSLVLQVLNEQPINSETRVLLEEVRRLIRF